MLLVTALMLAGLISTSTPFVLTDFLKDSITASWENAPKVGATFFFCSKEPENVLKDLSRLGIPLWVAQPHKWTDALSSISSSNLQGFQTMVVDMQCPKADQLLREASKLHIVRSPFRWMLLNVTIETQTQRSCQDFASEISANGSILAEGKAADADIVLVCQGFGSLILVDLWGPLAPTILGRWSPASRLQSDRRPPAVRRMAEGLNGYVFRTAFVVTNNNSINHLNDDINKTQDYLTKFHYEVIHNVAHMLNSTVYPLYTKDWGYFINGSWNGLVGLQERGEAEVGGTGTSPNYGRLLIHTPLNYASYVAGVFMFREPPMSYNSNLFTQPFPANLWLATIGLLSLGAVQMYIIFRLEETSVPSEGELSQSRVSWSDVVFMVFGAVCQQGSSFEPRNVTSRMITLFVFLSILFLYTSYTASIVALLQSTSSNIYHYKDFLDSSIELGVQDVSFNHYYLKMNNDTYRRRVYLEKLIKYGRRDPFMSIEEGVKKMRTSYFAFLAVQAEVYQNIADTFEEHEKCGLRDVYYDFTGLINTMVTISKWSTHAELFRIGLRKVQERGIRQRQVQRFMPSKPVCMNQGGKFQSVALIDCYGAFMALVGGWGFATVLLIIETFVRRRLERQKLKVVKPSNK